MKQKKFIKTPLALSVFRNKVEKNVSNGCGLITMLCISVIFAPDACAISSIRGITVTIKNKTPQDFIVKLVNLESSQEVLVEVLNAQWLGRDVVRMVVPPELYGISIFHPPTNKTTNISAKALRGILAPGGSCAQVLLRPRIYVGEPQIEFSPC